MSLTSVDLSEYILTFFFFNDTATTEIYTLSLHDALPISPVARSRMGEGQGPRRARRPVSTRARGSSRVRRRTDRKSTRLNSSHSQISYAVFCLKKKKTKQKLYKPASTTTQFILPRAAHVY